LLLNSAPDRMRDWLLHFAPCGLTLTLKALTPIEIGNRRNKL